MKAIIILAVLGVLALFAWSAVLQFRLFWHVKPRQRSDLRRALRRNDFAAARSLVEPQGHEALARLQSARNVTLAALIAFGLLGLGNAIIAGWK